MAECPEGCGMCCLCQPEILDSEIPFFRKNHPQSVCRTKGPDGYTAIKLKKGRGSCVFLNSDSKCEVYDHRTTYCRQFPYHIYVSDRVQVELDLSCRGLWTGKGIEARKEAEDIVKRAGPRIRDALPEASEVYRQFRQYAAEAGVMKDPEYLRGTVEETLYRFTEQEFLCKVLEASSELPNMTIADALKPGKSDLRELNNAARDAAHRVPPRLPVLNGGHKEIQKNCRRPQHQVTVQPIPALHDHVWRESHQHRCEKDHDRIVLKDPLCQFAAEHQRERGEHEDWQPHQPHTEPEHLEQPGAQKGIQAALPRAEIVQIDRPRLHPPVHAEIR